MSKQTALNLMNPFSVNVSIKIKLEIRISSGLHITNERTSGCGTVMQAYLEINPYNKEKGQISYLEAV